MWRKLVLTVAFIADLAIGLEPLTTGFGMGVAAVFGSIGYKFGYQCKFQECCSPPWIKNDIAEFESLFDRHVFGQHLVKSAVSKALRSHFRHFTFGDDGRHTSGKALVLSFHGWTGSGKNYVAKFIAESLFAEGLRSDFVHQFVPAYHFRDETMVNDVNKLQDWIRNNVSICHQSMFIFDEVDKTAPAILNAVKPFIDSHDVLDGVDFRLAIFVFLSNSGGRAITDQVHKLWKEGTIRESITTSDLEKTVMMASFNEPGGLQGSELLIHHLVDHYVAFLPLERTHVGQCAQVGVEKALLKANIDCDGPTMDLLIKGIVDDMFFWPEYEELFSKVGCKRVDKKAGFAVEEIDEYLSKGNPYRGPMGPRCYRLARAIEDSESWSFFKNPFGGASG